MCEASLKSLSYGVVEYISYLFQFHISDSFLIFVICEEQGMFDILCVLEPGRSSKSKQTIVNTLLFALYGHRGLNANVSYIICLKHRTAKSVLTCVVNVKIGWD